MTWWQRLWRRKQIEEQLDKELRFHFDEHAADLIASGYAPDEARRQARLALGGFQQLKEECRDARGARWLEDLSQDVCYALRTLRKNRGFAAVALVTLALGTGATTVMFTVIDRVLLKPLPYREPEHLLTLYGKTEKYGENWGSSYLDFLDIRRASLSLDIAAWTDGGGTVGGPGDAEYAGGARISSNLFSVLGTPLLRGRGFLPEEDRPGAAPVIIISLWLWQRRYGGSEGVVGSSLTFDGKPYTVIGIARSGFQLLEAGDVYTPLGQNWADPRMQNRGARFVHILSRLRPDVALTSAQTELNVIGRRLAEHYPKFDSGRGFAAHALGPEVVRDVRSTLWLLLAAVGMVLLIACANTASLLLARAISRERELGLRAALGASRSRLVRECLTESAVLGFAGGGLGVLLAAIGTRPFVLFWPGALPRAEEVRLDWQVLAVALAVALASGLLFGMAPAARVSARELDHSLRAGARIAVGSRRAHGGFVIAEIALALVLLVSAGMLGRTLLRLSSLDPGINLHKVLTARVEPPLSAPSSPAAMRASWQELLDRTRRVPGVESVALADIIPMRMGENSLGYWTTAEMPPPDRAPVALASCVSPDYFKVVGIPLRQGRFFTEQDRIGSEPVVVIDEVMAGHAFGGTEAVGRRLWVQGLGPAPVQVIGVVGHVRHWGLAGDDQSRVRDQLYYPFGQVPDQFMQLLSSVMSVAVRTKVEPLSVVEPLRHEGRGVAGDQVLHDVYTLDQLASASLARQRFLLLLFGVFAVLALLLACVGIYGVLAYLTGRRVPEIGVRMALGASARAVMWMVLRQSLGLICAGAGVGLFAALAAGQLLTRFVEGMRPAEPSTFVIMISTLVTSALLASFAPARRASRVDPMTSLRQD